MWKNNHLFFHKPYSVHNMCTSCAYSGITIYNETKSLARKLLHDRYLQYLKTGDILYPTILMVENCGCI